jgi:GNAT superfamily N-acetyltransferase
VSTVVDRASIAIVPYRSELSAAFAALNRAWIEGLFRLEDADRKVLDDPEGTIIAPGGQIYFALDGAEVVGTVAAVRESAAVFELAKMAVRPSHRGRGVGQRLGGAVIDFARAAGAEMVFLETNSALANAVRLYERLGFQHAPRPHPSAYERSNVYMALQLRPRR